MIIKTEYIVTAIALAVTLGMLFFAVNWSSFRDWVPLFFFKSTLSLILGSIVVEKGMLIYPVRLSEDLFDTSILFEILVLPTLCILYNQITFRRGLRPALIYALLLSAVITTLEYLIELYTDLIEYTGWSWFFTLAFLTGIFMLSRFFLLFYRWGCRHFGRAA